MNWDQIEGKWKQIQGSFREKFGKLTNDDVATLGGKKDKLLGVLQEKYGQSREEAERQLEEWRKSIDGADEVPTSTSGAPTY
ncbi:MAG: CsbD family protein [Bryobacterales bacterium]|nr:CsbD family protein [Bryobacterales bacterium]